jgi:hypothetical protein
MGFVLFIMTLWMLPALSQTNMMPEQCDGQADCEGDDLSLLQVWQTVEKGRKGLNVQSPFHAVRCSSTQVETTAHLTYDDYDHMIKEMRRLYDTLPISCNQTSCPQGDFAGCVLRLAAHDFMDYSSGQGGSDGCIAFDDPDNNGLAECLYQGEYGISVIDAYEKFCLHVSLADFLVVAGEAVMTFTRENVLKEHPSRSTVDFRSGFRYGRTTNKQCAWAYGRMPNPEDSCRGVSEVFGKRMSLSWNQSAALMGAHTLGRAEPKFSGYDGSWKERMNSNKFDNQYFQALILKGWAPETKIGGNELKNQWQRTDMGVDESLYGREMMLNTDLCLLYTVNDVNQIKHPADVIEMNAARAGCSCAWVAPRSVPEVVQANGGKFCGVPQMYNTTERYDGQPEEQPTDHNAASLYFYPNTLNFTKQRVFCCIMTKSVLQEPLLLTPKADCGIPKQPAGPASKSILEFAADEDAWLEKFTEAWHIATSNGHNVLKSIKSGVSNGRRLLVAMMSCIVALYFRA